MSLFCYIHTMNNKITIYESFVGKSTGTFLKTHINESLESNYFVYYIDTIGGFLKYGIPEHGYENLCIVKHIDYAMLHTLFNKIIAVCVGDVNKFSIIIDHFELIEVEHPQQKNVLLKLLHNLAKYAPIVITSIGKMDGVKISSMPSNVMCCDYYEVEFNV